MPDAWWPAVPPPRSYATPPCGRCSSAACMLEVRGLSAGYGSMPVLHDIALSVQPGEILLVAGENGAGKTTLLRTLAGFIRPTAGTVTLGGAGITGLAPERVARAGLRLVLDGQIGRAS